VFSHSSCGIGQETDIGDAVYEIRNGTGVCMARRNLAFAARFSQG